MAVVHTVKQGETLTRIAKQYSYSSWKSIYYDPSNSEFQKLRPNPDLIFPGDKINIPDIKPRKMTVGATRQHVFCVKREGEYFRLKIQNRKGESWTGKKVVLDADGDMQEFTLDESGIVEFNLGDKELSNAKLDVYTDDDIDYPSHSIELKLGHLDPVEELSGVQARCNALGFDCGVVDGLNGKNTEKGVKAFQKAHGLVVDGIAGPNTKKKLKEVYGH